MAPFAPSVKKNIIRTTVDNGLCIGCGFCAAFCPRSAITLVFDRFRKYVPFVEEQRCDECAACETVCPNTPASLTDYACRAAAEGLEFGLHNAVGTFFGYDLQEEKRFRSASGGIVTAFLSHLLDERLVDTVIAAGSKSARCGEPFHEIALFRTAAELEKSRSSRYYPLPYTEIMKIVREGHETYALVGLPCTLRAVKKLPASVRKRLKFTVSLFCSHNVTGQFLEYQARREQLAEDQPYSTNFRDKTGARDARGFSISFAMADGTVRRVPFPFPYWKHFFFACEACLYCPDAYGAEADISAKDAWGSDSVADPLGASYFVVRTPETMDVMKELKRSGRIRLDPIDTKTMRSSQRQILQFKHVSTRNRIIFKSAIRTALKEKGHRIRKSDFFAPGPVLQYLVRLITLRVSGRQYALFPALSLNWLVGVNKVLDRVFLRKKKKAKTRPS